MIKKTSLRNVGYDDKTLIKKHSFKPESRIPTVKFKIPGKLFLKSNPELLLHSSYSFWRWLSTSGSGWELASTPPWKNCEKHFIFFRPRMIPCVDPWLNPDWMSFILERKSSKELKLHFVCLYNHLNWSQSRGADRDQRTTHSERFEVQTFWSLPSYFWPGWIDRARLDQTRFG